MKELFLKENRVNSTISKKGRVEKLVFTIITLLIFILSSFYFFEMAYELCNIGGAIVEKCTQQAIVNLNRVAPFLLLGVGIIFLNISLNCVMRARSLEIRIRNARNDGIAAICFGFVVILYIIISLINKTFGSIVEGNPTLIYPLDILIGGLIMIGFGVLGIWYSKYVKNNKSELPIYDDKRHKVMRGFDKVFYVIFYLVALFSFASFIYSFFVLDWTHGGCFFNITYLLSILLPLFAFGFYRFVFIELKDEYKNKCQVISSIVFLALGLLVAILSFIALKVENEAPARNAFGLLPIEYTASLGAFPFIYALVNVASPLSGLIKGLVDRHNINKSKKQ